MTDGDGRLVGAGGCGYGAVHEITDGSRDERPRTVRDHEGRGVDRPRWSLVLRDGPVSRSTRGLSGLAAGVAWAWLVELLGPG